MKIKILLIPLLFVIIKGFANPVAPPPLISELYLNGNSIQIEFFIDEEWWWMYELENFDNLRLISSIDTVEFIDGISFNINEIVVVSQDDLMESFGYNVEGDLIIVVDDDGYYELASIKFGNYPGAVVPAPNENQSIAYHKSVDNIQYSEYYTIGLEQPPSVGYNEFNIQARGVIAGNIVDLNNNPVQGVEFIFPYFDPVSSYNPHYSDENGNFIIDNLLSRNYGFYYFIGDYSAWLNSLIYPYDTTYVEIQLDTLLQGTPKYQNYPNPFIGVTSFSIQIPKETNFNIGHLSIYNLAGKLVDQIDIPSNDYTAEWNSNNLEPGIYLYNIVLDSKQFATKKMIML